MISIGLAGGPRPLIGSSIPQRGLDSVTLQLTKLLLHLLLSGILNWFEFGSAVIELTILSTLNVPVVVLVPEHALTLAGPLHLRSAWCNRRLRTKRHLKTNSATGVISGLSSGCSHIGLQQNEPRPSEEPSPSDQPSSGLMCLGKCLSWTAMASFTAQWPPFSRTVIRQKTHRVQVSISFSSNWK